MFMFPFSAMVQERSQYRRVEKDWLLERTALSRKLQLLDRLGGTARLQLGQHAEQRLESRSAIQLSKYRFVYKYVLL